MNKGWIRVIAKLVSKINSQNVVVVVTEFKISLLTPWPRARLYWATGFSCNFFFFFINWMKIFALYFGFEFKFKIKMSIQDKKCLCPRDEVTGFVFCFHSKKKSTADGWKTGRSLLQMVKLVFCLITYKKHFKYFRFCLMKFQLT